MLVKNRLKTNIINNHKTSASFSLVSAISTSSLYHLPSLNPLTWCCGGMIPSFMASYSFVRFHNPVLCVIPILSLSALSSVIVSASDNGSCAMSPSSLKASSILSTHFLLAIKSLILSSSLRIISLTKSSIGYNLHKFGYSEFVGIPSSSPTIVS